MGLGRATVRRGGDKGDAASLLISLRQRLVWAGSDADVQPDASSTNRRCSDLDACGPRSQRWSALPVLACHNANPG